MSDTIQERVLALSAAMADQVKDDHTYTEVFNALSGSLIAFILDYLTAEGVAVTEANVETEFNRFAAVVAMQARHVIASPEVQSFLSQKSQH